MNNETIFEIKIKYRADRVYDIYLNGVWVGSRGSYENVADMIKEIIRDDKDCNKNALGIEG